MSSSSVSAKPVASLMISSLKPSWRSAAFARYSALPAEHYIGTAAPHIGGNGNGARHTRLCYNFRLFFVVLCVKHVVLYARGA